MENLSVTSRFDAGGGEAMVTLAWKGWSVDATLSPFMSTAEARCPEHDLVRLQATREAGGPAKVRLAKGVDFDLVEGAPGLRLLGRAAEEAAQLEPLLCGLLEEGLPDGA